MVVPKPYVLLIDGTGHLLFFPYIRYRTGTGTGTGTSTGTSTGTGTDNAGPVVRSSGRR